MNLLKTLYFTNYNTFTLQKESKEHFQALSKAPIIITEAVYTVKLISYLHSYAHLHCVVSNERIHQRASEISVVLAMTHLNASDWSMHS